MITIYHNPRCRKSREGMEILEKSGKDYQIREYLKEALDEQEIEDLLQKLQLTPIQIVRKKESIWKENYKDRDLSDKEIIAIMAKHPKLIERPIVETKNKAVLGRPPVNIENIL